jgi:hypothetical protein
VVVSILNTIAIANITIIKPNFVFWVVLSVYLSIFQWYTEDLVGATFRGTLKGFYCYKGLLSRDVPVGEIGGVTPLIQHPLFIHFYPLNPP